MTPKDIATLDWVQAVVPTRPPYLAQLSGHSPLRVWHLDVAFDEWPIPSHLADRWTDKKLNSTETWNRRPLVASTVSVSTYFCGEVELVARLRSAGFHAHWISEWNAFPHIEAWEPFCVKRSELRSKLPDVWAADQLLRSSSEFVHALGTSGGHPDIVAWRAGDREFRYLEYKGPDDSINPKQSMWAETVTRLAGQGIWYVAVKGAFPGVTASPRASLVERPVAGSAWPVAPVPPEPVLNRVSRSSGQLSLGQEEQRMPSSDGLHRRAIRSALKKQFNWDVVSRVDGTIDVFVPPRVGSIEEFARQVQTAVEALGYRPTIVSTTVDRRRCIKVHTAETLEQRGRGGH